MSKVQPTRPGAPRRPVPGAPAGTAQRQDQNLDELRNLPAYVDDGIDAEIDPENASAGKMVEETATIVSAKFAIQDWRRKDGSYPETAVPEMQLQVSYRRDGDEDGSKLYTEGYKYGSVALFAPTKDGLHVKVRPNIVKEGGYAPRPRKMASAILFLQSIKDAGGGNVIERFKTEGTKALNGLRVHVRARKVEGMSEKARPVLLVDYIDGVAKSTTPAVASRSTEAAIQQPVAHAAAAQEDAAPNPIDQLAEAALLDVLAEAEGGSLSRAQIPTTLIRIEKWKSHGQRGAILKALKEDAFINRTGAPWKVSGNTLSL